MSFYFLLTYIFSSIIVVSLHSCKNTTTIPQNKEVSIVVPRNAKSCFNLLNSTSHIRLRIHQELQSVCGDCSCGVLTIFDRRVKLSSLCLGQTVNSEIISVTNQLQLVFKQSSTKFVDIQINATAVNRTCTDFIEGNTTLHSPSFPDSYTSCNCLWVCRNERKEWIEVVFTDFSLLADSSFSSCSAVVQFYEENSPPRSICGVNGRPHSILVNWPKIFISFTCNGVQPRRSGFPSATLGFRAEVKWGVDEQRSKMQMCGRVFDNSYGALVNLTFPSEHDAEGYDCVWAIAAPTGFGLFLKTSNSLTNNEQFIVKDGYTSTAQALSHFDGAPSFYFSKSSMYIHYIRFPNKKLETSFFIFSAHSNACNDKNLFRCKSHKICIVKNLTCDSVSNCPDGSDEDKSLACWERHENSQNEVDVPVIIVVILLILAMALILLFVFCVIVRLNRKDPPQLPIPTPAPPHQEPTVTYMNGELPAPLQIAQEVYVIPPPYEQCIDEMNSDKTHLLNEQ